MKVKMMKDYKVLFTVYEVEQMKAVIASVKEDATPVKDYAEMAVNHALADTGDCCLEILKAEAEVCKNKNITWDLYGDNTGICDVYISGIAETSEGFCRFGAYLSDIWQTGAIEYKDRMWLKRYKAVD